MADFLATPALDEGYLSDAVRVRISKELLDRLDTMETSLRDRDYRRATRSTIIRAGINLILDAFDKSERATLPLPRDSHL